MSQAQAQENLIHAVLRRLSSERVDPHTHFEDELEYCDDMILEAATALLEEHNFQVRKLCVACQGTGKIQRPGWYCGCGPGVRHISDCRNPAPFDFCPFCYGTGVTLPEKKAVIVALEDTGGFS